MSGVSFCGDTEAEVTLNKGEAGSQEHRKQSCNQEGFLGGEEGRRDGLFTPGKEWDLKGRLEQG